MKIRGEFIGVNLATGDKYELVVGDGEVRIVTHGEKCPVCAAPAPRLTEDEVRLDEVRKAPCDYHCQSNLGFGSLLCDCWKSSRIKALSTNLLAPRTAKPAPHTSHRDFVETCSECRKEAGLPASDKPEAKGGR
jgi:hypothetical protein